MPDAFSLFDTAIGRCGMAWNASHILAIAIPGDSDAATTSRLKRVSGASRPAAPPPFVQAAIDAIAAHLAGFDAALDTLPLDLSRVSTFDRKVLEATRRIPSGSVETYGALASQLGDRQAARAVGAALGRNPWPIVVPCHRVVAANGKLGGFSAPGGRSSKIRLLEIEGAIPADEAPTLFDAPAKARPRRAVGKARQQTAT